MRRSRQYQMSTRQSSSETRARVPAARYATARDASEIFGVHRDFFRKTPELRRNRIELTKRTHLYDLDAVEEYFRKRRGT